MQAPELTWDDLRHATPSNVPTHIKHLMLRAAGQGATYADLSARYDVDMATVWVIVNGCTVHMGCVPLGTWPAPNPRPSAEPVRITPIVAVRAGETQADWHMRVHFDMSALDAQRDGEWENPL